jgi:hypothetical protein
MNRFNARSILLALSILSFAWISSAATQSPKTAVVPKWARFEKSFASSNSYTNPIQEVVLRVVFTSPSGETTEVPGFWDGGRTWRVRFAPDQLGQWAFSTYCSDTENAGLHHQLGGFLCTASVGLNAFSKHGEVRVARGGHHLEHLDGTPYFLAADAALQGAMQSSLREWQIYANTRALQGFNAAVWAAGPGLDAEGKTGIGGYSDSVEIDPDYFRRLDERLEALREAGLMSVIIPFSEGLAAKEGGAELRDDQVILLLRYLAARWDSSPIIWLLPIEGEGLKPQAAKWRRIGAAVFGQGRHAPVMVQGRMHGTVFFDFKSESWVKAFASGVETNDAEELAKELMALGFAEDAETASTPRPMIPFLPEEVTNDSGKGASTDLIRHAAIWTLLSSRPAGFCYAAFGVSDWQKSEIALEGDEHFPFWRKALFAPGARQVSNLAKQLRGIAFGTLKPDQKILRNPPDKKAPAGLVTASTSEDGALILAYSPQGEPLHFRAGVLSGSGTVTWYNPRSGETRTDPATSSADLSPPGAGDWLVLIQGNR